MVCRNGKERRGQAARTALPPSPHPRGEAPTTPPPPGGPAGRLPGGARPRGTRGGDAPASPPQAGCPAGGLTAAAGYGQEQRPINCGYCSILRDSSQTKGKQAAKFSEKRGQKGIAKAIFFCYTI